MMEKMVSFRLLFFVFLVQVHGELLNDTDCVSTLGPAQCSSLQELYMNTDGPNWAYASAWFSGYPCCTPPAYHHWFGLSCECTGSPPYNVTQVRLIGINASGSLEQVDFSRLPELNFFELTECPNIQGGLPTSLFSHNVIGHIDLHGNQITGSLPSIDAPNLWYLDVSENKLNGSFPKVLNAPSLQSFSGANNSLDGSIAPLLASTLLQDVNLGFNRFSLDIPELTLPNVTRLVLAGNLLSGEVDFSKWKTENLQQLDLHNNSLSGSIDALKYLSKLISVDLSRNKFGGSLNSFLADHCSLMPQRTTPLMRFGYNLLSIDWSDSDLAFLLRSCGVVYLDVRGNSVPTLPGIPSWVFLDSLQQMKFSALGNQSNVCGISPIHEFDCFFLGVRESSCQLMVDPPVFNYSNCHCSSGHWGIPPHCPACPFESLCPGTNYFEMTSPAFPVILDQGLCVAFLECESDSCNATKVFYTGNPERDQSRVTEVVCREGSTGRLCSRCECTIEKCFFSEDGCQPCGTNHVAVVVSSVSIGVCISLFIIFPRSLSAGVIELLCVLVLLIVSSGNFALVELLILILILHFVENFSGIDDVNGKIARSDLVTFSGLAKITLFYLQTTSLLNADYLWPKEWGIVNAALKVVTSAFSGGLTCSALIKQKRIEEIRGEEWALLFSFLFTLALPFFLFCSLLLLEILVAFRDFIVLRLCCRSRKRKNVVVVVVDEDRPDLVDPPRRENPSSRLKFPFEARPWLRRLMHVGLFVLYACYYEVVTSVFEMLRCTKEHLPDSVAQTWLDSAPWLNCASADYLPIQISGWVFFGVYVLGIPLIFGVLLVFHWRNHLNDEEPPNWYGFLMENYRRRYFFFEMVWILRRLLISLSVSFIDHRSLFRPFIVVFGLLSVVIIQVKLKPFRLKFENVVDLVASCVILLTFLGAALTQALQGSSSQCADNSLEWFCQGLNEVALNYTLLALNFCLVAFLLGLFIYQVVLKIKARRAELKLKKARPQNLREHWTLIRDLDSEIDS